MFGVFLTACKYFPEHLNNDLWGFSVSQICWVTVFFELSLLCVKAEKRKGI